MPGADLPRVPTGLRDLMKSLTKEVLREKPPDIYEFSAQYFETMLGGRKDLLVDAKTFEPAMNYETIIKNRERNQAPLALVYSIIPDTLTELIKEFIKAVLRANPPDICSFAVLYFRGLQRAKETKLNRNVEYGAYDNYFKSKERFSFTPYVKCTCGRTFGEGMMQGHYETSTTTRISKTHSVETWQKEERTVVINGEATTPLDAATETATSKEEKVSVLRDMKATTTTTTTTNNISPRKEVLEESVNTANLGSYEDEKYIRAIYIIQRFIRRALKAKQLLRSGGIKLASNATNRTPAEEPKPPTEAENGIPTKQMTEGAAAFIIQRTLRTLFNEKRRQLKGPHVPSLENFPSKDDANDNVSEAASYTSASTALLSAESAGDNTETLVSPSHNDGEITQKTIFECDEAELEHANERNNEIDDFITGTPQKNNGPTSPKAMSAAFIMAESRSPDGVPVPQYDEIEESAKLADFANNLNGSNSEKTLTELTEGEGVVNETTISNDSKPNSQETANKQVETKDIEEDITEKTALESNAKPKTEAAEDVHEHVPENAEQNIANLTMAGSNQEPNEANVSRPHSVDDIPLSVVKDSDEGSEGVKASTALDNEPDHSNNIDNTDEHSDKLLSEAEDGLDENKGQSNKILSASNETAEVLTKAVAQVEAISNSVEEIHSEESDLIDVDNNVRTSTIDRSTEKISIEKEAIKSADNVNEGQEGDEYDQLQQQAVEEALNKVLATAEWIVNPVPDKATNIPSSQSEAADSKDEDAGKVIDNVENNEPFKSTSELNDKNGDTLDQSTTDQQDTVTNKKDLIARSMSKAEDDEILVENGDTNSLLATNKDVISEQHAFARNDDKEKTTSTIADTTLASVESVTEESQMDDNSESPNVLKNTDDHVQSTEDSPDYNSDLSAETNKLHAHKDKSVTGDSQKESATVPSETENNLPLSETEAKGEKDKGVEDSDSTKSIMNDVEETAASSAVALLNSDSATVSVTDLIVDKDVISQLVAEEIDQVKYDSKEEDIKNEPTSKSTEAPIPQQTSSVEQNEPGDKADGIGSPETILNEASENQADGKDNTANILMDSNIRLSEAEPEKSAQQSSEGNERHKRQVENSMDNDEEDEPETLTESTSSELTQIERSVLENVNENSLKEVHELTVEDDLKEMSSLDVNSENMKMEETSLESLDKPETKVPILTQDTTPGSGINNVGDFENGVETESLSKLISKPKLYTATENVGKDSVVSAPFEEHPQSVDILDNTKEIESLRESHSKLTTGSPYEADKLLGESTAKEETESKPLHSPIVSEDPPHASEAKLQHVEMKEETEPQLSIVTIEQHQAAGTDKVAEDAELSMHATDTERISENSGLPIPAPDNDKATRDPQLHMPSDNTDRSSGIAGLPIPAADTEKANDDRELLMHAADTERTTKDSALPIQAADSEKASENSEAPIQATDTDKADEDPENNQIEVESLSKLISQSKINHPSSATEKNSTVNLNDNGESVVNPEVESITGTPNLQSDQPLEDIIDNDTEIESLSKLLLQSKHDSPEIEISSEDKDDVTGDNTATEKFVTNEDESADNKMEIDSLSQLLAQSKNQSQPDSPEDWPKIASPKADSLDDHPNVGTTTNLEVEEESLSEMLALSKESKDSLTQSKEEETISSGIPNEENRPVTLEPDADTNRPGDDTSVESIKDDYTNMAVIGENKSENPNNVESTTPLASEHDARTNANNLASVDLLKVDAKYEDTANDVRTTLKGIPENVDDKDSVEVPALRKGVNSEDDMLTPVDSTNLEANNDHKTDLPIVIKADGHETVNYESDTAVQASKQDADSNDELSINMEQHNISSADDITAPDQQKPENVEIKDTHVTAITTEQDLTSLDDVLSPTNEQTEDSLNSSNHQIEVESLQKRLGVSKPDSASLETKDEHVEKQSPEDFPDPSYESPPIDIHSHESEEPTGTYRDKMQESSEEHTTSMPTEHHTDLQTNEVANSTTDSGMEANTTDIVPKDTAHKPTFTEEYAAKNDSLEAGHQTGESPKNNSIHQNSANSNVATNRTPAGEDNKAATYEEEDATDSEVQRRNAANLRQSYGTSDDTAHPEHGKPSRETSESALQPGNDENISNSPTDKPIGTQNLDESRSESIVNTTRTGSDSKKLDKPNSHITTNDPNSVNKSIRTNKRLGTEPTDRMIAEIHLKSFKLPEHLEAIPWYEALASKEYYSDGTSKEEEGLITQVPPEVELQAVAEISIPRVAKTETQNDDETLKKSQLNVNAVKSQNKNYDATENANISDNGSCRKIKINEVAEEKTETVNESDSAKERSPTYLYGASAQHGGAMLSRRAEKGSTAFVIPFDSEGKKTTDKPHEARDGDKMKSNQDKPNTASASFSTAPSLADKALNKAKLLPAKLNLNGQEYIEKETEIALESPTKLFAELNQFDDDNDTDFDDKLYSLNETYTLEDATRMLNLSELRQSPTEEPITPRDLGNDETKSVSSSPDQGLQTILEVNESETPHEITLEEINASLTRNKIMSSAKDEEKPKPVQTLDSNREPNLNKESERLEIGSEMHKMGSLVQAAIIIQKHFRKFLAKKKTDKLKARLASQLTQDIDQPTREISPINITANGASEHYRDMSRDNDNLPHDSKKIQRESDQDASSSANKIRSIPSLIQAAIIIQKSYRGYLARKQNRQKRSAILAAHKMQDSVVETVLNPGKEVNRNISSENPEHQITSLPSLIQAAIIIQKTYRGYIARKLNRPKIAARAGEVTSSGKEANKGISVNNNEPQITSMAAFIQAAIIIQKTYRGYFARKQNRQKRAVLAAAQVGSVSEKEENTDDNIKQDISQEKPGHQLTSMVSLIQAAIIIQKSYRGYLARKQIRQRGSTRTPLVSEKEENVVGATCDEKEHNSNQRITSMPSLIHAAIIIQKTYRGYVTRKQNRQKRAIPPVEQVASVSEKDEIPLRTDHAMNQAIVQEKTGHQPTSMAALIQAAIIIQKTYRGYLARKQNRQKQAILSVSQLNSVPEKEEIPLRTDHAMNQAIVQEKTGHQPTSMAALIQAAIIIQKTYRGYLARKQRQQIGNRKVSSQKSSAKKEAHVKDIDLTMDSENNAESATKLDNQITSITALIQAAIVIQKTYRGYLARKKGEQMRTQIKSAVTFEAGDTNQDKQLRKLEVKPTIDHLDYQNANENPDPRTSSIADLVKSAIIIQKSYRGYLVRKRHRMMRTHEAMVSNLPTPPNHEPGGSVESEKEYENEDEDDSETASHMFTTVQAAIIIQRAFKRYLTNKKAMQEALAIEQPMLAIEDTESHHVPAQQSDNTLPTSNDSIKNAAASVIQHAYRNFTQRQKRAANDHTKDPPIPASEQDANQGVPLSTSSDSIDETNFDRLTLKSSDTYWNESQTTEIPNDNDSLNSEGTEVELKLTASGEGLEAVAPENERENEETDNEIEEGREKSKVQWFVGNDQIVSTPNLNATFIVDHLQEGSPDNVTSTTNITDVVDDSSNVNDLSKIPTALASSSPDSNLSPLDDTSAVRSSPKSILLANENLSDMPRKPLKLPDDKVSAANDQSLGEPGEMPPKGNMEDAGTDQPEADSMESAISKRENDTLALHSGNMEPNDDPSKLRATLADFLTAERQFCDSDKAEPKGSVTDQVYDKIADYLNNAADTNLPYEKLEESPCIKKTITDTTIKDNEAAESSISTEPDVLKDDHFATTDTETESSGEDTLQTMTEKLREADEVIVRMQQRRASATRSNSGSQTASTREPSFDTPDVHILQDTRQIFSPDTEEDSEVIVMKRLQREETRESSAQSDDVVYGGEDSDDLDLDEFTTIQKPLMKRTHTIAVDDTRSLFKSVTIDQSVRYIEPAESETTATPTALSTSATTSNSSFCLDDSTSENIREKMLAYSLSEADSDYFDVTGGGDGGSRGGGDVGDNIVDGAAVGAAATSGSHMDKANLSHDDFNISTALADTFDSSSTASESTIVSAATKIQAGARGFLTRRRLRRISGGTKSIEAGDTKASFGNDAISESLERLVEDEAAKKIQQAYRSHYRKNQRPIVASAKSRTSSKIPAGAPHLGPDPLRQAASLESTLAARRMTLQRGDALRNDSTPEEEHSNGGREESKSPSSTTSTGEDKRKNKLRRPAASNAGDTAAITATGIPIAVGSTLALKAPTTKAATTTTITTAAAAAGTAPRTAAASERARRINESKLKWMGIRQNSMPVQIESEVLRVIPKHMRKRIKSAEATDKKLRRRRALND